MNVGLILILTAIIIFVLIFILGALIDFTWYFVLFGFLAFILFISGIATINANTFKEVISDENVQKLMVAGNPTAAVASKIKTG